MTHDDDLKKLGFREKRHRSALGTKRAVSLEDITVLKVKTHRGPTGAAIFTIDGKRFYWNGRGSQLKFMFGDQLVTIDHYTANGNYDTERDAKSAAIRFMQAK